jgi:hypothetical protein
VPFILYLCYYVISSYIRKCHESKLLQKCELPVPSQLKIALFVSNWNFILFSVKFCWTFIFIFLNFCVCLLWQPFSSTLLSGRLPIYLYKNVKNCYVVISVENQFVNKLCHIQLAISSHVFQTFIITWHSYWPNEKIKYLILNHSLLFSVSALLGNILNNRSLNIDADCVAEPRHFHPASPPAPTKNLYGSGSFG